MEGRGWVYNDMDKMLTDNQKSIIKFIILMMCLYVVQFLAIPNIVPTYFSESNEATAIFWITQAFVIIIGFFTITAKFKNYLIADLIYTALPIIYSANGAYGVGYGSYYHFRSVIIEYVISLLSLIFFQLLFWLILLAIQKIKSTIRQNNHI